MLIMKQKLSGRRRLADSILDVAWSLSVEMNE